jgi:hypothetical protein
LALFVTGGAAGLVLLQDVPAPAALASGPIVAAAGDIACDPADPYFKGGNGTSTRCHQAKTANILLTSGASAVLPLGDDQYECAGLAAFAQSYHPTWGNLKSITYPSIGNHEYETSGGTDCDRTGRAGGYFSYYGSGGPAPVNCPSGGITPPCGPGGYYSFDIGAWHLIALNANCNKVSGGCGSTSPQVTWLKSDLAASHSLCTLAYWHQPRFSSTYSSPNSSMLGAWNALYQAGAEIVLNGHVHNYQRFAPRTPSGTVSSAKGIREFIVGTGGMSLGSLGSYRTNMEAGFKSFGVLQLTLLPASYTWQFVSDTGTILDSGNFACH